jgi:hypothetical protein
MLGQLSACATMRKTDCLNADWHQFGYNAGLKGDLEKTKTFNAQKEACNKKGISANWEQFKQGHSNGIAEFCQLKNAVELGVRGVERAIDNEVCHEEDYPGFSESFWVGYILHVLKNRVNESKAEIASLRSNADKLREHLREIRSDGQGLSNRIRNIESRIEKAQWRLNEDLPIRDNYSHFIYQDYIPKLSREFIVPRQRETSNNAQ